MPSLPLAGHPHLRSAAPAKLVTPAPLPLTRATFELLCVEATDRTRDAIETIVAIAEHGVIQYRLTRSVGWAASGL
jgi:hypothetical protein